jgi:hypothetical protein
MPPLLPAAAAFPCPPWPVQFLRDIQRLHSPLHQSNCVHGNINEELILAREGPRGTQLGLLDYGMAEHAIKGSVLHACHGGQAGAAGACATHTA